MSTTTIYSHPDGHEVTVGNGLLTAVTSEGAAASIPIGAVGLAELGNALLERAVAAAQDASEEAGAELGLDLVRELYELRGCPQAESFKALRHALLELVKLEYPESACGGFSATVTSALQIGIANLAEVEPE